MLRKDWIFAIVSGTVLLFAVFWILKVAFPSVENDSTLLSAIVLLGLVLTVILMALLAIVYKVLGIENQTQALGLPEGSVRALLAFSLVVMFVCLGAFLFTAVNKRCENCAKTLSRVTDAQLSDLKTNFTVAAEQARDDKGKLLYEQTPGPNDATGKPTIIDDLKHPYYSVTYYPKQSTDVTDFAKQIFTTLATIFVSVVSFYFGSSVTSSAVRAGANAALGPGGDQQSAGLQASLTSALAESHNAQAAVDKATADLKKAQDELAASPADPQKQAAVNTAQKALDDANKNLADKQAKV